MNKRQEYIEKVKKGIDVYEIMETMKDAEKFLISYRGNVYAISCMVYQGKEEERKSYSIGDNQMFGRQMNIDLEKSGKSYLYCYTFDLFGTPTTKTLDFGEVEFVNEEE